MNATVPANVILSAKTVPTLADVIARVEADAFLEAIRFEPYVYANHYFTGAMIAQCRAANHCNIATARVLLSMSYGEFQIMGFNLYDAATCNYKLAIGDYLTSKLAQCKALQAFLESDHIAYSAQEMLDPNKRQHFAEKYNGPGNVAEYSAKILTAALALGVTA